MDCETYTNLIDSYLCGELSVETYHSMLWHFDNCYACRTEMVARTWLRHQLQRACASLQAGESFQTRLREKLRAELHPKAHHEEE